MNRFQPLGRGLTTVVAAMIFGRSAMAAPAATAPTALALQVTPTTFASNAGATAASGTVARPAPAAGALVVTLKSGDTSLARVPATVTIPAGAVSVTFPVSAVSSNVVRGTRQLHIMASAPGFKPARVQLHVTDSAKAALRLTIRPRRFSENAGANAATGQVTRNTMSEGLAQPLVVTLQSTDTSEARVPATVTIPAGQQNATFPVSAVANAAKRVRGMATLHITASAPGFTAATATIVVTDTPATRPVTTTTTTTVHTQITLALTIKPATVASTGGPNAASATVTRAPVANTPLVVTLRSTDTSLARVPATVTIPAGQASATFSVSAVVNPALKGRNKGVHITAVAAGFPGATVALTVTH